MFTSSIEAETAFYDAFSNADIDSMMRVWAQGPEIACIHPSGPRLAGSAEIRQSWTMILTERVLRSFDLRGRIILGSDNVRVHILEENISVPGTAFVAPPVLATNVYQRLGDGWFMVLHHASVAPSALSEEGVSDQTQSAPVSVH